MHRFPLLFRVEQERIAEVAIPLHGMHDGVVYLPDGLSPIEWQYALKITKFLLDNYRRDAIVACRTEWNNLFPAYRPLSGANFHDYLSKIILV